MRSSSEATTEDGSLQDAEDLARLVLTGNRRALSRAISEVENRTERGARVLQLLYGHAGNAHIIGITGSAGSGKSTLTAGLARAFRRLGRNLGIIAVDPSSPFTRGAILGDRIRMQDLTADPGIFLRSMATRGAIGGLSATTADAATVLDAAGREIVLIETVGAGQDEVDVARVADTTLVISTPGMGDDIQAIKAGILEVADILVVNKADLPGSDAVVGQLRALLSFAPEGDWPIPVVKVSALKEQGLEDLLAAIGAHRDYAGASQRAAGTRLARARARILEAAKSELTRRLMERDHGSALDSLADRVASRAIDPRSAAIHLLKELP